MNLAPFCTIRLTDEEKYRLYCCKESNIAVHIEFYCCQLYGAEYGIHFANYGVKPPRTIINRFMHHSSIYPRKYFYEYSIPKRKLLFLKSIEIKYNRKDEEAPFVFYGEGEHNLGRL